MRGNPHVRFGPEVAGKGPALCRHLAGVVAARLWLRHEVARCEWLRNGGRLMPET